MKKLIIVTLMMCLVGMTYGQTKITIPTSTSKSFYWKDGSGTIKKVDFQNSAKLGVSQKLLELGVMQTMSDAQYGLKLKESFIPINVMVMDDVDTTFVLVITYSGKNLYNTTITQKTFYTISRNIIKGEYMDEVKIINKFSN